MSGIVSDPTTLTKEKLKEELTKFDVDLPSSAAKKGVYVELYREHVLNQTSEFSADEEVSPKLSKKKLLKKKPSEKMASSGVDVMSLSDEDLSAMLQDMGVEMGPILPTTRKVYQKKLQKLLESAGEPAPASQSSSQDTVPVEDLDFSADSDPEEEEIPIVIPPQFDNVRRRQTRPEPPPSPPRRSKDVAPPSPRRSKVAPPPSPSRQLPHAPRTPPKLPQDARLVRPPISQQRPASSRPRTYDQTDSAAGSQAVQKKKGWMSVWLQLALLCLVGLIVFFVIQNMEPASNDPLKGLESKVP